MTLKITSMIASLGLLCSFQAAAHVEKEAVGEALAAVKVGEKAPDFTLKNEEGKDVTFADFSKDSNVVLIFSRAHW